MTTKKRVVYILIALLLIVIFSALFKKNNKKFDINQRINYYDIEIDRDNYLEYLKNNIYPQELRKFIYNDYITFGQYTDNATGNDLKNQMVYKAYELLFTSMFDKKRVNFDDCPVTDKFKKKYKTNLFDFYNLSASEDCKRICSLYRQGREIKVEVFGDFKNTEPTYLKTHYFKYTLDNEGNVDDVVFDYTE